MFFFYHHHFYYPYTYCALSKFEFLSFCWYSHTTQSALARKGENVGLIWLYFHGVTSSNQCQFSIEENNNNTQHVQCTQAVREIPKWIIIYNLSVIFEILLNHVNTEHTKHTPTQMLEHTFKCCNHAESEMRQANKWCIRSTRISTQKPNSTLSSAFWVYI